MFWIEGWVEIAPSDKAGEGDTHAWQGVMRVAPLVDVAGPISERLFGLSKAWVSGEDTTASVAARRGWPSSPSDELQHELERIQRHEVQYGPGEIGGCTHATWREMKAVESEPAMRASDWHLVFEILRCMEHDHRLADDRIRVVVWYNW